MGNPCQLIVTVPVCVASAGVRGLHDGGGPYDSVQTDVTRRLTIAPSLP